MPPYAATDNAFAIYSMCSLRMVVLNLYNIEGKCYVQCSGRNTVLCCDAICSLSRDRLACRSGPVGLLGRPGVFFLAETTAIVVWIRTAVLWPVCPGAPWWRLRSVPWECDQLIVLNIHRTETGVTAETGRLEWWCGPEVAWSCSFWFSSTSHQATRRRCSICRYSRNTIRQGEF